MSNNKKGVTPMQTSLPLVTFQYERQTPIRTVLIDGNPWFYAMDVCKALAIKNGPDAVSRLDTDDIGNTDAVDSLGRKARLTIVNESGLYGLVFQSRTEAAKDFKRWVTKEVLPQIRKTGAYSLFGKGLPAFIRRFNDNWDRVDQGYFSVISELAIRVYGRFEQLGHQLAEKAPDGKELRPDVSVGKTFAKWLKEYHPNENASFKTYKHYFSDIGFEVDARQYPNAMWPLYAEFIDTVWMLEYAPAYLESRDPIALELLPKLLPPPDPRLQEEAIAGSKFHRLKEQIRKLPDPKKKQ